MFTKKIKYLPLIKQTKLKRKKGRVKVPIRGLPLNYQTELSNSNVLAKNRPRSHNVTLQASDGFRDLSRRRASNLYGILVPGTNYQFGNLFHFLLLFVHANLLAIFSLPIFSGKHMQKIYFLALVIGCFSLASWSSDASDDSSEERSMPRGVYLIFADDSAIFGDELFLSTAKAANKTEIIFRTRDSDLYNDFVLPEVTSWVVHELENAKFSMLNRLDDNINRVVFGSLSGAEIKLIWPQETSASMPEIFTNPNNLPTFYKSPAIFFLVRSQESLLSISAIQEKAKWLQRNLKRHPDIFCPLVTDRTLTIEKFMVMDL